MLGVGLRLEWTAPRPGGCVLGVLRKPLKLARDAYQWILQNCPPYYLSSESPTKKRIPEDRHAERKTGDDRNDVNIS